MVQLRLLSVRCTLATFGKTCVAVANDFPIRLDTQTSASIILKNKIDNALICLDYKQVAKGVKSNRPRFCKAGGYYGYLVSRSY